MSFVSANRFWILCESIQGCLKQFNSLICRGLSNSDSLLPLCKCIVCSQHQKPRESNQFDCVFYITHHASDTHHCCSRHNYILSFSDTQEHTIASCQYHPTLQSVPLSIYVTPQPQIKLHMDPQSCALLGTRLQVHQQ